MYVSTFLRSGAAPALILGSLAAGGWRAEAADFTQTNLVSDIPGFATKTDTNLVNPWGMSDLMGSPIWLSNQGMNTATLYPVVGPTTVSQSPFVVSIPTTATVPPSPQGPTGQVSNPTTFFPLDPVAHPAGPNALFIFANLNGTISAWGPSLGASGTVPAVVVPTMTPGAVFTGLAISSSNPLQPQLFAADNANGQIDVFDGNFKLVSSATFVTPAAIKALGLTPFNVQDIGGNVFVTYALPTHAQQIAAVAGEGAVAEFTESGTLETVIGGPGSPLASPWGITAAPAGFGALGGDWLIGNESAADSGINAFDPATGMFVGPMINIDPGTDTTGAERTQALWALNFGFGGNGGDPNTLYFSEGLNGETQGLFGAISATVPETSTWTMMLAGFGGLAVVAMARRLRARATFG